MGNCVGCGDAVPVREKVREAEPVLFAVTVDVADESRDGEYEMEGVADGGGVNCSLRRISACTASDHAAAAALLSP